MNHPAISVIIPSYQHAGTLPGTLEAVLVQTLPPTEIIVIDDGSKDNTKEVIKPYLDRVTYVYQENQGGNAARNRGFQESTGEYVIFCDADVQMKPTMLEKLHTALQKHPEASYAYSAFRFGWKRFHGFPFKPERLKQMNFIHTTSLIRRKDFPGFDPSLKRLQDWDLWLTMLAKGKKGVFVNEELFQVIDERERTGISEWRPSLLYKIPWKKIGWMPPSMRKYEEAKRVLFEKHDI